VGFYSEYHAFADSRYGNSGNNVNSYFTLTQNVDLSQALNPRLEFRAKWAIEPPGFSLYDYARIQISTNDGTTWASLSTNHTQNYSGQPNYYGIKHWVKEDIDLSAYIGQQVRFRFLMHTDENTVGDGFYFDDFKVVDYEEILVGIGEKPETLPQKPALAQNYPNPFNPATTIRYEIPARLSGLKVVLRIYNNLGQEVRTLVNGTEKIGTRSIVWDGKNDLGQAVSSGIYLYRLRVGNEVLTKKMLFLK
jgi:hypothetical protein